MSFGSITVQRGDEDFEIYVNVCYSPPEPAVGYCGDLEVDSLAFRTDNDAPVTLTDEETHEIADRLWSVRPS